MVVHQSNRNNDSGYSNQNDALRLKLIGYVVSYGNIYQHCNFRYCGGWQGSFPWDLDRCIYLLVTFFLLK